jgi:uncharacterized DUF497 family protein
VKIEFDPAKDWINREKHGISLAVAAEIDLDSAIVIEDRRIDSRLHASGGPPACALVHNAR